MNVSAPALAPDLDSRLSMLTTPPDIALISAGFAPTQPHKPGAETPLTFESALADMLGAETKTGKRKSEEKLGEEPKQGEEPNLSESKLLVTGVAVPVTAAPEPPLGTLTMQLALPVRATPVKGDDEAEPARQTNRPKITSPRVVPHAAPVPVPDVTPAMPAPPTQAQEPVAEPLSLPDRALSLIEPAVRPASVAAEAGATDDLPHAAFSERFTPMPATDAMDVPVSAPPKHIADHERPAPTAESPALTPPRPYDAQTHDRGDYRDGGGTRHQDSPESVSQAAPASKPEKEQNAYERTLGDQLRLEPATPIAPAPGSASVPEPSHAPAALKSVNVPQAEVGPARQQSVDAHSISIRVSDVNEQKVDLKITDHAGQLRVAVRAADPGLAGSLRENLGDLVHKLEQSGLRAESWSASPPDSIDAPRRMSHSEGESGSGNTSGRQQQPGDGQHRRQQDRPQHAHWLEEYDTVFSSDSERSTTSWLSS